MKCLYKLNLPYRLFPGKFLRDPGDQTRLKEVLFEMPKRFSRREEP
jgi:hypothetical protein